MAERSPPATGKEKETVSSADGTGIAFERTGSGLPLVLVYGNGDVLDFWAGGGVRPALAEHHTVYAIERRGRGESGDATDRSSGGRPGANASGDGAGYELEREAEDVVAVVEAIDEPVTLLGHSGGALYSLEAAVRTDRLRNLVLYEPPIQVGDNRLDVAREVTEMETLLDRGENEQALESFYRDVAGLTPDELDALRSAPIWQDMVDAARTLPRELEAIAGYEFDAARFAELTTPTLLLTGSESPPLYGDATQAVDDALPNSRVATFEGEGHMAMHTAPGRFVDAVGAFVRDPD